MTTDNQQELFPVVDTEGRVTGSATRSECHSGSKLLHPVVHVYRCRYDGPVCPSAEELDGGRFWSLSEVRDAIGKGVLTPNFEHEFGRFFLA